MGANDKHKWKFPFRRRSSSSSSSSSNPKKLESKEIPKEFICPISGSLMSDPVIISSGQTFERLSTQVCLNLNFSPTLEDGSNPNFSLITPNLALKTTILHWCDKSGTLHPQVPDYTVLERIVVALMEKGKPQIGIGDSERELLNGVAKMPARVFSHAATELGHRVNRFYTSSSEESVIVGESPGTPLPFTTRPACYSSYSSCSSSSEILENESIVQTPAPDFEEEGKLISKLRSTEVFEQEEGVISLRKMTKTDEKIRVSLCTPRILSVLRLLISSRYSAVQINAVASLVNLSLENKNKVKIVRSGLVPELIDVLKGGYSESQEHAAGALFSLALEDENRMAIGVLGALQPLFHALRSDSERTRDDSALCLYNLTMIQSNRVKLVKLGAVPKLISMVESGNPGLASRVLLILCNVAVCSEGRAAMLDADAVECLVKMLREKEIEVESTRENCVAALYALSHGSGSMRFKGLAKEAKAMEVLMQIVDKGSERAREKAKSILQALRGREDGGETSGLSLTRYRIGGGRDPGTANTIAF